MGKTVAAILIALGYICIILGIGGYIWEDARILTDVSIKEYRDPLNGLGWTLVISGIIWYSIWRAVAKPKAA